MRLGKNIHPVLVFISLFFYSFGGANLAFAESNVLNADLTPILLDNSSPDAANNSSNGKTGKNPFKICHGIHGAHTTKKVVALTFDDGPHEEYTKGVLDVLKRYDVKGTFFLIGKNAERYPEIVKEMYAAGHVIGNHSYSHFFLTKLSASEIEKELTRTSKLIHGIVKSSPILFRPPYGACSAKSTQAIKKLGFTTIMWSAAVDDCHVDRTTSKKIAAEVIKLVRPGVIIALHDGGGIREKTVNALPIIIETLRDEGYEFLTIPEMLGINAYASLPEDKGISMVPPELPAKNIITMSENKGVSTEQALVVRGETNLPSTEDTMPVPNIKSIATLTTTKTSSMISPALKNSPEFLDGGAAIQTPLQEKSVLVNGVKSLEKPRQGAIE